MPVSTARRGGLAVLARAAIRVVSAASAVSVAAMAAMTKEMHGYHAHDDKQENPVLGKPSHASTP